jgi:hypothetical protein
MTPETDAATLAAQRWYGTHQGQYLAHDCERMVDRCADHLMELLPIARSAAQSAAMQTLADLQASQAPGFIDIDRSNSRMVVLRDSSRGTSHMVTLGELFELLQRRRVASAPPAG